MEENFACPTAEHLLSKSWLEMDAVTDVFNHNKVTMSCRQRKEGFSLFQLSAKMRET